MRTPQPRLNRADFKEWQDVLWRLSAEYQRTMERLVAERNAYRTAMEHAKQVIIALRDITRVVYANGYGSPGFQSEARERSEIADDAIEQVETALSAMSSKEKSNG